jgi:hypothetical protein
VRTFASVLFILLVAAAFLPSAASAEEAQAIQLSLFTPVQLRPEDTAIKYFRFNLIYGKNTTLVGLDLGLVNMLTAGESQTLQIGLANWVEADCKGLQYGALNVTRGTFTGWQWGFINSAGHAKGLMLGFLNVADSMYGVQIGLINVIKEGGMLPVFPIFNFSF